ncbi:MAG TPA: helix-turn-helix domain-containing protein [Pyrinomonadaceae bacterium]|jgi:transcriptional regulator with GAF, ATPase, and Fis domain|nr:helix-turn-helix domain-containing protein [Pyrinomonadaceae bacterium]
MKATTTWEQGEETDSPDDANVAASVELNVHANGNGNGQDEHPKADLYSKATALKRLVHSLLMEVQSLDNIPTVDFKEGIDFYEEVRRFEIALIQHALAQTGGHQMRAARLLSMKVTTLNSKIKHYDIRLDVLVGGLYLPDAGGNNGTRDQA